MMWLHDRSPLTGEELSSLCILMDDFKQALKCVQPSAKREGFASVPDVSWDDVGSLTSVREELQMAILAPIRHIHHFKELGLTTPTGVLLCGPPGCGKTLIAKAMANEAGINFISVKGPELLNMVPTYLQFFD
jgi:ribosome biogenesis ATPase